MEEGGCIYWDVDSIGLFFMKLVDVYYFEAVGCNLSGMV